MHATRIDQYPRDIKFETDTYDASQERTELDEMPNRLYWRPICDNDEPLDNQLKYILMEQDLLDHFLLTTKDLGMLKGIRAASGFLNQRDLACSTEKLIDAIEVYGSIQIFKKDII